jgi:hypothetical protein
METHQWAWVVLGKWVQAISQDQKDHPWATNLWVPEAQWVPAIPEAQWVPAIPEAQWVPAVPVVPEVHHHMLDLGVHRLAGSTKIHPLCRDPQHQTPTMHSSSTIFNSNYTQPIHEVAK